MLSLSQPFKYTSLSRASDNSDDAFEEEGYADKPMRMAPSPRRSFLRRHAAKLAVGLLLLLTLAAIAALTRAVRLTPSGDDNGPSTARSAPEMSGSPVFRQVGALPDITPS